MDMENIERDTLEVDVLFVGAGPASLAGALRLRQLINKRNEEHNNALGEITIAVIEKGREIGSHIISGAVMDVRPLAEIVQSDYAFRSVQANVLRAFAVVAVVLASVGLHGLLAFMVSARTREIGVRIALGAPRRDILSMVLGRGLKLACIGGAVGLGAGYMTGVSFRSVLAGVEPTDLVALSGAIAVAVAMTLAGSFWPAMRAAKTDPMTATRAD